MSDDSTSPVIRVGAAVLIAGFLLGSFLPVFDALRSSDSGTSQALLDSQLSRIPVFTVTDDTGRPFLTETDDHRFRRGYFFVQPADAEDFLQKVKEDNPDAKVLAVGLDKAAKFLFSKSTPAKSIPETFELFPDDEQASIAQKITDGAFEKTFGKYGVPIFYVDGLAVKDDKAGTPVYPLFFEKSKLDEALSNLKKNEPQSSLSETDLQVIDLSQTIKEIRAGANPRLNQVVFVPLTDSLEELKKLNSLPSS